MRALRRNQNIGDAVRLVAPKRIDAAIARLCRKHVPHLTDQSIHELRVHCKLMRGLLELLRTGMKIRRFRRARNGLRNVSRALAGGRDATAVLLAYRRMVRRGSVDLGQRYRRALEKRVEASRQLTATAGARSTLVENLLAVDRSITQWQAPDDAWRIASQGLRQLYIRGRSSLQRTMARGSVANLHELRKRSKRLMYACQFLRRMSDRCRSMALALKECTDLLGQHHDLSLLQDAIAEQRMIPERAARARLLRLISHDQATVRKRCTQLASGIYRESAKSFIGKVHRDWKHC